MKIALKTLLAGSMVIVINAAVYADTTLDDHKTLYAPSSRQGGVLFVEDNAGWGVATHPDPLWNTTLSFLLGAGNFGWFGPTYSSYDDGPDLATMQNYDLVIWNNYDHYDAPTLTENDRLAISTYIDSGGKFWLIAQDAIYSAVPYYFLESNFHLESYIQDYISEALSTHIRGLAEANGNSFLVTEDYVWGYFNPDDLTPDSNAHHIVKDTDWNYYPGILSNDSSTSFWAIDGRSPNPDSTWRTLVRDMLIVFRIIEPGVAETSQQTAVEELQLGISPDPFINSTIIHYDLPYTEDVTLAIFDYAGRHIITLIDGFRSAGSYTVNWNGTDKHGYRLPSGVYFCKLSSNTFLTTATIILLR